MPTLRLSFSRHSGFRLMALFALSLLVGCSSLPPLPPSEPEMAVPPGNDSRLDEIIAPAVSGHPNQSGFRLVHDGLEAFALRVHSANLAKRTLDVQTYIWTDDLAGLYLASTVLKAADRGVRVRLLVDDIDARAKHYGFAALAAHPNISVRHFNPFASRHGFLTKALEAMQSFKRINRRMHNKSWIADNRLAVAGGRNLGNQYFAASQEVNFADLDLAMIGPVVADVSASFDRYWNASVTYPVQVLAPDDVNDEALAKLRSKLAPKAQEARQGPYAKAVLDDAAVQKLLGADWPMLWTHDYRFVSDDPLKARGEKHGQQASNVLTILMPALKDSRERLSILSPYFVPGELGVQTLTGLAHQGVDVGVLTNSLAANDVVAVHGGYAKYREPLLEGGVKLWELKPQNAVRASLFGSSGASLHTKALVIDDSQIFVGSYNLDARSTSLNCEQGTLVRHPELARQLEALFQEQVRDNAWAVELEDGKLHWSDGRHEYDSDPFSTFGRRFTVWITRLLPIESQL